MDKKISVPVSFLLAGVLWLAAQPALAATQAKISIRFDDGIVSQYTTAAPILKKYNFPATEYIFTDGPDQNIPGYMTWAQIATLQRTYGWEIGDHTKSHANLTLLSDSELATELATSKATLAKHGITATSFVPPYGTYDMRTLAQIARYFDNANRDSNGYNTYPFNDYGITVQEVSRETTLDQAKAWIDEAAANKQWLVLLFHGVTASDPGPYDTLTPTFQGIADYIKAKKLPVVKISDGVKLTGSNRVSNPSFETAISGWASNWLRTSVTNIKLMTSNLGSQPNPKNSVEITGGAEEYSLYNRSLISVNPSNQYVLKAYFNCQNYQSGAVDVFVDEYDSAGKWTNWRWMTGIWSDFVGYRAVDYVPGANARYAVIWVKSAAGSDLTCNVDNVSLIQTSGSSYFSGSSLFSTIEDILNRLGVTASSTSAAW